MINYERNIVVTHKKRFPCKRLVLYILSQYISVPLTAFCFLLFKSDPVTALLFSVASFLFVLFPFSLSDRKAFTVIKLSEDGVLFNGKMLLWEDVKTAKIENGWYKKWYGFDRINRWIEDTLGDKQHTMFYCGKMICLNTTCEEFFENNEASCGICIEADAQTCKFISDHLPDYDLSVDKYKPEGKYKWTLTSIPVMLFVVSFTLLFGLIPTLVFYLFLGSIWKSVIVALPFVSAVSILMYEDYRDAFTIVRFYEDGIHTFYTFIPWDSITGLSVVASYVKLGFMIRSGGMIGINTTYSDKYFGGHSDKCVFIRNTARNRRILREKIKNFDKLLVAID